MEEGDWDLQAVVRGCNGGAGRRITDTATVAGNSFSSLTASIPLQEQHDGSQFGREEQLSDLFYHFPNLLRPTESSVKELEQLYRPFSPYRSSLSSWDWSIPPVRKPHIPKHQQQILSSYSPLLLQNDGFTPSGKQQQQQQQRPVSRLITTTTTRSKRRKSQQKSVVCHVPADGLSSDMWAWRKYGQKPIKGSPYPRGYYRCSSSKGCLARKQVERSRKDPGVFVITYTAEHNHSVPTHRNSLAGSVRNKFSQSKPTSSKHSIASGTKMKRSRLLLPSTSSMSPTTPLTPSMQEEEEEEEGEVPKVKKGGEMENGDEGMLLVSDMEMLCEDDVMMLLGNDDVLEQSSSVEHFPTLSAWPWISNDTHQRS